MILLNEFLSIDLGLTSSFFFLPVGMDFNHIWVIRFMWEMYVTKTDNSLKANGLKYWSGFILFVMWFWIAVQTEVNGLQKKRNVKIYLEKIADRGQSFEESLLQIDQLHLFDMIQREKKFLATNGQKMCKHIDQMKSCWNQKSKTKKSQRIRRKKKWKKFLHQHKVWGFEVGIEKNQPKVWVWQNHFWRSPIRWEECNFELWVVENNVW